MSPSEIARSQIRPQIPRIVSGISQACAESPVERIVVYFLDELLNSVGMHVIAEGTESSVSATWQAVFDKGWRARARWFVVGHNHPSGTMNRSGPDERFTRSMRTYGATLGIDLLDHIIVGPAAKTAGRYYSFWEADLI